MHKTPGKTGVFISTKEGNKYEQKNKFSVGSVNAYYYCNRGGKLVQPIQAQDQGDDPRFFVLNTFDGSIVKLTQYGIDYYESNGGKMVIPDKISGYDVKTIAEYAFAFTHLTSVEIPDSIEYIGEYAFCDNDLASVVMSNSIRSIGKYAFNGNKLTSVILPSSIREIKEGAFKGNIGMNTEREVYLYMESNPRNLEDVPGQHKIVAAKYLSQQIANLKRQLEDCQTRCSTDSEQCAKDKAALQEKINTLEKEISDIKEKIVKVIGDTETPDNLSDAADTLLKKVSDLETKVKDLETKVKELEAKLAEKDKENSELQKEKEQLEKDKAQLEKDKQILEEGKKKLEEEKKKLEEAKKSLEEKLGNTEKQIKDLTKEKEELKKEKKELEEKTGSTSEEDKAKIKELENKISEKDNSIKELKDKLEKGTKEKEELDKKLNDKDRQTKILEKIIEEKDEQCKKNTQNWIKEKEKWERDRYYWNYYDNRERRDILDRIKELEEENKYLNKKNDELKDKMKDYPTSSNKMGNLGNRGIISNLGERPSITGHTIPSVRIIFYLGNSTVERYQGNSLINSISMSDSKGNINPIINNNRTMLPVRYLAESLGMKVSWDQKTGTAAFDNSNGNNALRRGAITINSKTLKMRNEKGQLIVVDSKPFLQNGRFYASITNLAKAFNGSHGNVTDSTRSTIEWDQKNKRVIINKNVR